MPSSGWLPPHFRSEERALVRSGIHDWPAVAALADPMLRTLAADGSCSEARLMRLRGQARLMGDLDLAPEEAALLLHAGIADRRGLASCDPHAVHRQLGRLQRGLAGSALAPVPLARLLEWIQRARSGSGRSWN
ncbi:DUF4332 domain-containing protein [Cyanobium sp. FGCU-52]|nr:DUF4332 domain-containing protein [Cyanobium sp. FGCU52]